MKTTRRTVPLRWSLFAAFAFLVCLIACAILTFSFVKTLHMAQDMAVPLIETAQRRTDTELHRLFDPITEKAATAYGWAVAGLVECYNPEALMDLFLPGMSQLPQCVSMMVSDMNGYEFTLFRNGAERAHHPEEASDTWVTRDFRRENAPPTWPKSARWTLWDENGETRLSTWWEDPKWTKEEILEHRPSGTHPEDIGPEDLLYDPRERIWHQGPRAAYQERTLSEIVQNPDAAIHWTAVDYFFTSKAPGMTAGIAARDPGGDMVVFAYDLLLGDLSSFTRGLRPTENGKVFVFTPSGKLIGLPGNGPLQEKDARAAPLLQPVEQSGIPELAACVEHWRTGHTNETRPFRFQSQGRTWWAGIRPFPVSEEQALWLGVVIPESDVIGAARRERINILTMALAALALSMLLAWFVSRKFARPLHGLTEQSKRIAALDLTKETRVSSRLTEVLQLSDSLEAMRQSLMQYLSERARSEEELARSAQEWKTTFDATHDAIWILDKDQRILRTNQAAERYFHSPVERMIGKRCWEIVHGTRERILECPMPNARKSLRREKMELHTDDRWLEIVVDPILDEAGQWNGAVHIASDITDRKRAEEEFSQIFEMSLDMICIAEITTATFLRVNPAFTESLGYSQQELLGKPFLEFIHPEDVAPTQTVIEKKLLQGEKVINFVNRYRTQDGEYRWLSWVSHPVPEQGVTYAVAHDITTQKQAEEALQQSEERYRSLVENTLDGYFICEVPSGKFLFLNQSICDLQGYTQEEGLRLSIWDVVDSREHAFIRERLQARSQGTGPQFTTHTYRAIRKDGSAYQAEVSSSLVTYQGEVVLQGVLRDVTEKERLQQQLQQAQKLEAIGTLAGGIAHDFNNLLMGIQGRTSLLMAEGDSTHPAEEHLKGIEEYIRSATELTKQLLGFAKGGRYEVKPTDLNDLVKRSVQLFSRTRKEIKIHQNLQQDLWTVEADQRQIEQVLLNLYINAWQAMPAGGDLFLQTENTTLGASDEKYRSLPPGRYVEISVTDTGIGMDEATCRKVFDPFFTTKGMGRGTGLGLASAYGIVKNHDGLIHVQSEKAKGTTFTIHLPASDKDVALEKSQDVQLQKGTGTVLLVDDESMVIDVAQPMLETLGYTVLTALGGEEAIRVYREKPQEIDVIILDMVMPDLSGGETFDRLKKVDSGVRVILSSGYSIDGQAQDILSRGCAGFLQKPFSLNALSQKLRFVLDHPD